MKEKLRVDPRTGEMVPVLSAEGAELPDPTPMAPPVGFRPSPPLHERIRAMVQDFYMQQQQRDQVESPEEADDFDVDEEMDPSAPYEYNFEPPKDENEVHRRLVEAGWTPPAKPSRTPLEGGAPANNKPKAEPAGARVKEEDANNTVARPENNS